jgi:hypothetical protein
MDVASLSGTPLVNEPCLSLGVASRLSPWFQPWSPGQFSGGAVPRGDAEGGGHGAHAVRRYKSATPNNCPGVRVSTLGSAAITRLILQSPSVGFVGSARVSSLAQRSRFAHQSRSATTRAVEILKQRRRIRVECDTIREASFRSSGCTRSTSGCDTHRPPVPGLPADLVYQCGCIHGHHR